MELEIQEEPRKCLKCGYGRTSSEPGPDYACPKCGAVYAKLEAVQKARADAAEAEKTQTKYFERRMALQEKFGREEIAREEADGPAYLAAHAAYLFMILPFAVTQGLAIAIAFKMHRPGDESWLNDHFRWLIRTFWYLGGLAVLAGAALLVGAASMSAGAVFRNFGLIDLSFKSAGGFLVVCSVAVVIAVYRIGKGWYRLSQREAP